MTDEGNGNDGNILSRTGTTLAWKFASFGLQMATLRQLDAVTLGETQVRLDLLLSTVLFVSREGFRLALTRATIDDGAREKDSLSVDGRSAQVKAKRTWNVAWLTIPVSTVVAGCSMMWHIVATRRHLGDDSDHHSDFDHRAFRKREDYLFAGILYCLASWIEGCGEPPVLWFLRRLDVPMRASAESLATFAKSATAVTLLRVGGLASAGFPATAIGASQLAYALTYSAYMYFRAFRTSKGKGADRNASFRGPDFFTIPRPYFDHDACRTTLIVTIQGLFKHVLTEADKLVLAMVSDSYDQGVYVMGAAYGGIAARILLQPLEENARLLWSRLAAESPPSDENSNSNLYLSYVSLMKLVLYLGLLFGCVGVNYTNLLLCVLAGRQWGSNAEAATVLSAFCVYTAFMAVNGTAEAFVYASISNSAREMTKLGMAHFLTGVVFALCALGSVTRYGAVGLVTANCVAMSIRSVYSIRFASKYLGRGGGDMPSTNAMMMRIVADLLPHQAVLASFAASFAATRWSFRQLASRGMHLALNMDIRNREWIKLTTLHLATGVSCVLVTASLSLLLERQFFSSLRSTMMVRRGGANDKQD